MSIKPAIDYTNKDFESLRKGMIELARFRLPEWTDHSAADAGSLMVDLFAYAADVVLYYQDRIANECFLETANERRSVVDQLRLIGYELLPPAPARADLTLVFEHGEGEPPTSVTVPHGLAFETADGAVTFEYLGDDRIVSIPGELSVDAEGNRLAVIPVVEGSRRTDVILGSTTGERNQRFFLAEAPVVPESVEVSVDEGAGFVPWVRRESFLYHVDASGRVRTSSPDSQDFVVRVQDDGQVSVDFGDGELGRAPTSGLPNNVRASFRVAGGVRGNVAARVITEPLGSTPFLIGAYNENPAAGGQDAETLAHAKQYAPMVHRSRQRAVTLSDVEALAHRAGGVSQARARTTGWNAIELVVAPEGENWRPLPDALRARIEDFFEDRRMATTDIHVRGAERAELEVHMDVVAAHNHDPSAVQLDVEAAIRALFAYGRLEFGESLYLSKVYEAVEAILGVHAVTVTRFRRRGEVNPAIQEVLDHFGVADIADLPEVVRRGLDVEIAGDGKILVDELEIAVLVELIVEVTS